MPRPRATPVPDVPRPDVIVDFIAKRGVLFVSLKNIGARSAYVVRTRFAPPFHGLGGEKRLSDMLLFRQLGFLPPGKEFRQLVDPIAAYFQRREPAKITATITYRDRDGRRFEEVIEHDLRIFKDLGFVMSREE
jgi:hypothetical protein